MSNATAIENPMFEPDVNKSTQPQEQTAVQQRVDVPAIYIAPTCIAVGEPVLHSSSCSNNWTMLTLDGVQISEDKQRLSTETNIVCVMVGIR